MFTLKCQNLNCGKEFQSSKRKVRFCSIKCAHWKAIDLEKEGDLYVRNCPKCNCKIYSPNLQCSRKSYKNKKLCDECFKMEKFVKIKEIFEKAGFELLSTEYVYDQKLKYLCKCGQIKTVNLQQFKKGNRLCRKCAYKLPIEDVILKFAESGAILLETEYKNNRTPLRFKCKCGKEHKCTLAKLHRSPARCLKCGNESRKKNKRKNYFIIKEEIENLNYELLLTENEYNQLEINDGGFIKIPIKCNNGHIFTRSHNHINKNKCPFCSYKDKSGKNSMLYIDGRSKINATERNKNNTKLRKWRRHVLKRYGENCLICKSNEAIESHHLNGYNWDVKNRFSIENGRPLCEECHNDFHKKYGKGDNTKEQFEEYLKENTPQYYDFSDWI